jgi:hypothetical protein
MWWTDIPDAVAEKLRRREESLHNRNSARFGIGFDRLGILRLATEQEPVSP